MKSSKASKVRAGHPVGAVLKRVIHPRHLRRVIHLQRGKRLTRVAYNDPQLQLYSKILPGEFLHYGYFDDPETQPQEISLNDIYRAQLRYAELMLQNIADRDSPILDVGCGMGGLIKLMLDRGLSPVALTPDGNQISYVRSRYPQVPVIETKFEDMSREENLNHYGTVITAESLQYLDLEVSLPLIEKLLKPGGRWIACDYFRIGAAKNKAEHWDDFEKRILQSGLRFVHQQDITPNVLPTLRYVYMWGNDIARPVLSFALEKLQTLQPGVFYILEEVTKTLSKKVDRELEVVNPNTYAATSKYMLLVLEKQ